METKGYLGRWLPKRFRRKHVSEYLYGARWQKQNERNWLMFRLYGSNTYCRNHKSVICTGAQYIANISYWHIQHIVVYKNCYWVLHDFLLGGIGRLAYVRRDSPVHVVRFVRYVTLIGDYYVLLRSRFALCLYGFCRVGLQLLGILERDERPF